MKELDLHPWLIRMSQGDEEAFQVVYDSTSEHAYRLISYLVPSQHDAGDVMSEVYMELLRSLDKYDMNRSFASWFNGLIMRQARNWRRRNWRLFRIVEKVRTIAPVLAAAKDAEAQLSALNDRLTLQPMLQTLPYKLKEIVILRYYQDCTLEEIAVLLNIPLGTVKSRHHHALKQLRRRFDQSDIRKERNGIVY